MTVSLTDRLNQILPRVTSEAFLSSDGIGNENGLCESNETCLMTPNIGAYQGHGELVDAGTYSDSDLTNITLVRYAENGR